MHFAGSMVALVTPFRNGQVDEKALRDLVEWQIAAGTQVLVPCGTTGESATLSHQEHDRVIGIVVEQAAKRVKVLAGAGSNATQEALRLHKYCESVGCDGALQITPYYNKPTQEGLYQHFKALAEASPLPLVLYNVPSRTSVSLNVDTVLRLMAFKNIVGIKEASGSLASATEILQAARADFGLYSGEDALNYPLYALGAHGAISVTCNVAPALCALQYRAVQNSDFEKAKKIHYDLYALHKALFLETNPIPVKAALSLMGKIEEEYRLPLVKMGAENRDALKNVLRAMQQIF